MPLDARVTAPPVEAAPLSLTPAPPAEAAPPSRTPAPPVKIDVSGMNFYYGHQRVLEDDQRQLSAQ